MAEHEEYPVDFMRPHTLAEALAARAEHPDAVPIAGGTDVMVELNFDRRRPSALLDLNRVAELHEHGREGGHVRLGAAVTYARIIAELGAELPGLAMAARTVGSPQIRNRGSVGGNLGAASPAGDSHPALLAAGADVELVSVRGTRTVAAQDFYTGVKRTVLAPDELITAVHLAPAEGPQQFGKIGTRNAMVIAVCAFGLALHPVRRRVGTGSVRPRRHPAARRRPRSSWPANWTGTPPGRCSTRCCAASARWWPRPPPRSTTSGAAPPTAGTRCPSWPAVPSAGRGATTCEEEPGHAREPDGQRRAARGRRRVAG